jgi:twitching motility protein PilI
MAERLSLREYQRELAARLRDAERRQSASKLGLRIGEEDWLVNLVDAGEIIQVPAITGVPLTRTWFRGVTNIRGNLMSVVDFAAFLGGAAVAITEHSRLLLIGEQFRMGAALLVSRSLGLHSPANLQARTGRGAKAPWTRAEYTDAEGRAWKELDMPQLVRHPEFLSVAA